jgi:hypothetical protein
VASVAERLAEAEAHLGALKTHGANLEVRVAETKSLCGAGPLGIGSPLPGDERRQAVALLRDFESEVRDNTILIERAQKTVDQLRAKNLAKVRSAIALPRKAAHDDFWAHFEGMCAALGVICAIDAKEKAAGGHPAQHIDVKQLRMFSRQMFKGIDRDDTRRAAA